MDHQTHFFKYTKLFMNLMGLMEPEMSNTRLLYVYRTWTILTQSCAVVLFLSFVLKLQSLTVDDLLRNDEMTAFWNCVMTLVKLLYVQSDTMRKDIREMFKLESDIDKDDEGINRKYLMHSRYNSKIFFTVACIYFGTLCQVLWLMKYSWATKTLLFSTWLPNEVNNYYFTCTFVFQIVSSILLTSYNLTLDTLFTAVILFPAMLLNILGHKFKHFEEYCKKEGCQPVLALRRLIMEHQAIIRYVKQLDSYLKWFFFIDFLVKSHHLSMMIVSLITPSDGMSAALLFALFKLAYWSVEAWCLYYNGNELIVESLNLSTNIFESKWHEYDRELKKMLSIVMLRSRKPLELHIGVFQPLSNDILLKFFKAAYSVIAYTFKS